MADVNSAGRDLVGTFSQLFAALKAPGPAPQEITDLSRLWHRVPGRVLKRPNAFMIRLQKIRTIDLPLAQPGFIPPEREIPLPGTPLRRQVVLSTRCESD